MSVNVDGLNIIGTSGEISQTGECLQKEFEMKDLGKTKFCLGLQFEYVEKGILVHQKTYKETILKQFNMDQAHPLSSLMVVTSLDQERDPFGPKKPDEETLGPECPYLGAIGALIYLQGTKDLGLFYTGRPGESLAGYADAGYLSDPHNARSQTGYVFMHSGAARVVWPWERKRKSQLSQLKDGYIKGDRTKHILPTFFFTHDLQKAKEVHVVQVQSSDNSADLFTKSLPTTTFKKLVHQIGMRQLKDLN
ncbi:uncharacterized protein LOC103874874 [Brassica rapa]|uniref:uncharacterized protein LOC103874874 n=1 Tax=Brassica campestris TaxID=3711 RepID=UPI00142D7712|nr:uncharacterized protein LOC103874874 [Brassica rapa]